MTTPQWHKDLEDLALTGFSGQTTMFNLPQLKGFIAELLDAKLAKLVEEIQQMCNIGTDYKKTVGYDGAARDAASLIGEEMSKKV